VKGRLQRRQIEVQTPGQPTSRHVPATIAITAHYVTQGLHSRPHPHTPGKNIPGMEGSPGARAGSPKMTGMRLPAGHCRQRHPQRQQHRPRKGAVLPTEARRGQGNKRAGGRGPANSNPRKP
jgi:hypothetical protein